MCHLKFQGLSYMFYYCLNENHPPTWPSYRSKNLLTSVNLTAYIMLYYHLYIFLCSLCFWAILFIRFSWFSFYMYKCYAFMCVCEPCVCLMPREVRRLQSLWNCSRRWLWAAIWVLQTEPRTSAREVSTLNHWTISSVPNLFFLNWQMIYTQLANMDTLWHDSRKLSNMYYLTY